ncbi:hypothetical protein OAV92_04445 [Crocinitomicaceae bacterium]|nr:hypothetical protein [Crocinitomicaceae bacterium]
MKNKALKIVVWYLLISFTVSILLRIFMFSTRLYSEGNITDAGRWFKSIVLGLVIGWSITATLCRIKFGEVPILKIFAAVPAVFFPFTLIIINVPAGSLGLLIFPLVFLQAVFMFSYFFWLNGFEFFALFKRSTYSALFRERKDK